MYRVYLKGVMFPVAPAKIKISNPSSTKTVKTLNGEVRLINSPALRDIEFDVLLPGVEHPFAVYTDGFKEPEVYIEFLNAIKREKEPVTLSILKQQLSKTFTNLDGKYYENYDVVLDSFTVVDDASEGADRVVNLKLSEFELSKYSIGRIRQDINSPTNKLFENTADGVKHITKKGDSLATLSKQYYGSFNYAMQIRDANRDVLKSTYCVPGTTLKIPHPSTLITFEPLGG